VRVIVFGRSFGPIIISTRWVTEVFLEIDFPPSTKEQAIWPGFFFDVDAANGSAAAMRV
jgi:hypothetical protein